MKFISWNVNGIRSVYNKGFKDWIETENPDIICVQELKAHAHQIPLDITGSKKYHITHNTAEKKGYSGVAVFSKEKPINVVDKLGHKRFDNEGRMIHLEFSNYSLINFYIPHGGRQKENLDYKIEVYKKLMQYLANIKNKKLILTGDFNIAHTELDLARPKGNKNNIMFTPEERSLLDELLKLDFCDTFRLFNNEGGHYSWWPWRNNARARNVGWRIDYMYANNLIKPSIKHASILRDVTGSDHCPIEIVI